VGRECAEPAFVSSEPDDEALDAKLRCDDVCQLRASASTSLRVPFTARMHPYVQFLALPPGDRVIVGFPVTYWEIRKLVCLPIRVVRSVGTTQLNAAACSGVAVHYTDSSISSNNDIGSTKRMFQQYIVPSRELLQGEWLAT